MEESVSLEDDFLETEEDGELSKPAKYEEVKGKGDGTVGGNYQEPANPIGDRLYVSSAEEGNQTFVKKGIFEFSIPANLEEIEAQKHCAFNEDVESNNYSHVEETIGNNYPAVTIVKDKGVCGLKFGGPWD